MKMKMKMKVTSKRVVLESNIFLCAGRFDDALSPEYQNDRDLAVMITFINKHESVLSTLKSIDLENSTVYFDNTCKAIFGRKKTVKPHRWVGQIIRLEFKYSNCILKK